MPGVVAPEASLSTSPNLICQMNAFRSLVRNGLTTCDEGVGSSKSSRSCTSDPKGTADGWLAYTPPSRNVSELVDDLDVLLTTGRLGATVREIIIEQVR